MFFSKTSLIFGLHLPHQPRMYELVLQFKVFFFKKIACSQSLFALIVKIFWSEKEVSTEFEETSYKRKIIKYNSLGNK